MFKMIVAMSRDRGIGYCNSLPWKLQKDMNYFKKITVGKENNCVIMGKNTWFSLRSSISEPLPKRDKIIMSSNNLSVYTPNCKLVNNLQSVLDICKKNNYDENWIIGGQQIYETFIKEDIVDEIYITEIHNDFLCDRFFPELTNQFKLSHTTETLWENNSSFKFKIYRKLK